MVFRHRWNVVTTVIVVLGSSMLSCAHQPGSASPKSAVAAPFRRADQPAAARAGRSGQRNVDQALQGLKPSDRPTPALAAPQSTTRPDTERQPSIGTAVTSSSSSVVIVAQPVPSSVTGTAAAPPPVASNNGVDSDRGADRLRPTGATLIALASIALALIAAIVWLPRLRHRGWSTRRQGT